jgi:hypothetical protein
MRPLELVGTFCSLPEKMKKERKKGKAIPVTGYGGP